MPISPFWSRAMSPASPCDEDAELGRLEGGELLAEQAGDHAGQDVAGASCGHAGIAGRVDVIPASVGDDGAGSLEHRRRAASESAASARPVRSGLTGRRRLSRRSSRANSPG